MLPNSQLHLLQKIEKRRRYRNWATALQVVLVIFFTDQILKTYCNRHLEVGASRSVVGQSSLVVSRIPKRGFLEEKVAPFGLSWLSWMAGQVPFVILLILIGAMVLRLHEAKLAELCVFALAIGGSLSNLYNTWIGQMSIATLGLHWGDGRYFLAFNIADLMLIVGGGILLSRLTRTVLAELRWVLMRQTG